MTSQLTWRNANDWLLIGSRDGGDLYEIKRELDYSKHPAVNWRYLPRCVAEGGYPIPGAFHDSMLARQACEDDLNQLQRVAASTKKG